MTTTDIIINPIESIKRVYDDDENWIIMKTDIELEEPKLTEEEMYLFIKNIGKTKFLSLFYDNNHNLCIKSSAPKSSEGETYYINPKPDNIILVTLDRIIRSQKPLWIHIDPTINDPEIIIKDNIFNEMKKLGYKLDDMYINNTYTQYTY